MKVKRKQWISLKWSFAKTVIYMISFPFIMKNNPNLNNNVWWVCSNMILLFLNRSFYNWSILCLFCMKRQIMHIWIWNLKMFWFQRLVNFSFVILVLQSTHHLMLPNHSELLHTWRQRFTTVDFHHAWAFHWSVHCCS